MPTAAPHVRAFYKQIRKACALLRLPGQSAAARVAQERVVRDALGIIDDQMDQFVDVRKALFHKAEKKWVSDLLKVHAERPEWVDLDAPELDRQIQAYAQDFKRRSAKKGRTHRLQFTAEHKRVTASIAYHLLTKYSFKPTGHRKGKFVRLAGILYNGNPNPKVPPCYNYCRELLQKKKALRKKKPGRKSRP
jgi:hypothetical protein